MKENILADSSKLICNIAVGKGNTSNITPTVFKKGAE